jgi:lysophospholipase L1-like esterase
MGYPRARRYEEVKVLSSPAGTALKITSGRKEIWWKSWDRDSYMFPPFDLTIVPVDTPVQKLDFSFTDPYIPVVYATALDCKKGIQVDNISMRGSSGTDFHRMDIERYAAMAKALNVRMLILQYGVNVVPYVRSDYNFYERQFYKELMLLRRALNVPILVIGVSDMSTKGEGRYISYPNVESIRDAQRNAAFQAGCAYWDLYEAMGGKNSMPTWVNAQPSLAEKDYTHFSARGARLIGQMISNALLREYYLWKERNAQ